MLARRIIPCLDVRGGRVVKGVRFVDLVDAGDPVEVAARYDAVLLGCVAGVLRLPVGPFGLVGVLVLGVVLYFAATLSTSSRRAREFRRWAAG